MIRTSGFFNLRVREQAGDHDHQPGEDGREHPRGGDVVRLGLALREIWDVPVVVALVASALRAAESDPIAVAKTPASTSPRMPVGITLRM